MIVNAWHGGRVPRRFRAFARATDRNYSLHVPRTPDFLQSRAKHGFFSSKPWADLAEWERVDGTGADPAVDHDAMRGSTRLRMPPLSRLEPELSVAASKCGLGRASGERHAQTRLGPENEEKMTEDMMTSHPTSAARPQESARCLEDIFAPGRTRGHGLPAAIAIKLLAERMQLGSRYHYVPGGVDTIACAQAESLDLPARESAACQRLRYKSGDGT